MGKMPKAITLDRFSILIAITILLAVFAAGNVSQPFFKIQAKKTAIVSTTSEQKPDVASLSAVVLPSQGFTFKIKWGNLGQKMVDDGVIDESKLAKAITGSDTLPQDFKKYLDGSAGDSITINQDSAQFWVDVLWGLGLANKNAILEKGPMTEGGNTANFASTGGYTLGVNKPMTYYSQYSYIKLTPDQQKVVEEIAGNIYRPCCGNSTAFPDCNHGMAALALVELMVSQGFSKDEIYKIVLAFNSYWFPQTYLDIAYHFSKNGKDFTKVSAQEILGKTFSSAMGYQAIKKQIGEVDWPSQKRSGCGA